MHVDTSPTRSGAFPYGADQGAVTSPLLARMTNPPDSEDIYIGVVTDVSTAHHCCTVSVKLKTSGFGMPCVWTSAAINRWGGVVETNPPEVGSVVAVYFMKNANHGIVLGQLPSLMVDPTEERGFYLDPIHEVHSFLEDSGQLWRQYGAGGSVLNGYQRHQHDVFPGERVFHNELGCFLGLLRFRAIFGASELAKLEAYVADDLLRIVGHNLDFWTAGSEFNVREDKSGAIGTEYNESMHAKEARFSSTKYFPSRRRILGGCFGDIERDFVLIPSFDDDTPDTGLSEVYRDSSGLVMSRSVVGGGIVKTRSIGVPRRKRDAQDPEGANDKLDPPDQKMLKDFEWEDQKPVDRSQQLRDALAWVMNAQASEKLAPFSDKTKDWDLNDDSPELSGAIDKGSEGGNVATGGHFRGEVSELDVTTIDTQGDGKPRAIKINDAWVFVLPDGTVSIRDGWATCVTLSKGHVTISPSKDLNLIIGRNLNIKVGGDVTMQAHDSVDISADNGQARVYAKKSAFVHSEEGGLLFSTNGDGGKSKPDKVGEEFETGGIMFKTPSTVSTFANYQYSHIKEVWSVGGQLQGKNLSRPDIFFDGDSVSTKSKGSVTWKAGSRYMAMWDSPTTLRVGGTVETEGNFDAPVGTVRINKSHQDHEKEDFCISPSKEWYLLDDLLTPFYENRKGSGNSSGVRSKARSKCKASGGGGGGSDPGTERFDWMKLHGAYDLTELQKIGFSFRTEKDYGTESEDFAWTQQAWMREWQGAGTWSNPAFTKAKDGRPETYPYPGKKHWTQSKSFFKYEEVNVDRVGNVKSRTQLANSGKFTGTTFKQLGRHP